jgi:hypothetical protein
MRQLSQRSHLIPHQQDRHTAIMKLHATTAIVCTAAAHLRARRRGPSPPPGHRQAARHRRRLHGRRSGAGSGVVFDSDEMGHVNLNHIKTNSMHLWRLSECPIEPPIVRSCTVSPTTNSNIHSSRAFLSPLVEPCIQQKLPLPVSWSDHIMRFAINLGSL